MKKLLLASAIAALSVSAANAAPTVYGKAFLTADYVNAEIDYPANLNSLDPEDARYRKDVDEDTVEINSVGSKIGLKGAEPLSANTDVIYQLEYGIRVDGEDRTLKSRDTYLGLKNNSFGEFRVGRNFSVIDNINNIYRTEGYFDNIGASTLRSESDGDDKDLIRALTLTDGTRINNSIVWTAPQVNDIPLQLALMYGADEGFGSDDNGFGASLFFDAGTGFTAGIAYDKDMSLSEGGERLAYNAAGDAIYDNQTGEQLMFSPGGELIRGTASIDFAKYGSVPLTLGALYQEADYDFAGSKKEKGMILSAEWALSNLAHPAVAYVQYDKTDNVGGIDNLDSDQVVVGGKYSYRNNIIAHAYAGINSADRGATDAEVIAVGGGLEYLF